MANHVTDSDKKRGKISAYLATALRSQSASIHTRRPDTCTRVLTDHVEQDSPLQSIRRSHRSRPAAATTGETTHLFSQSQLL